MYDYVVEIDHLSSWYWAVSFNAYIDKIGENDYIDFLRTNFETRYVQLVLYKDKIELKHKDRNYRQTFEHHIELNGLINIKIICLYEKIQYIINDKIIEFMCPISSCKETKIISSFKLFNFKLKYLNFNSDIPRVYGDCFVNTHTHKMFGKYLMTNGANYYCYGKPSPNVEDDIINGLIYDINICKPNKVFLFMLSNLQWLPKQYLLLKNRFKNIDFIINTAVRLNKNDKPYIFYNQFVRNQKLFKYIDFDKDFQKLENKEDYFIDEAHTSELGAQLIVNRLKKDAPELFIKYKLEDFN